MNINVKNINDCTVSNKVEQVSNLVYEGFKYKFTSKLFSDKEVFGVITSLCEYIILKKPEKLYIAESSGTICACLFLTTNGEKYTDLYSSLKKSLSLSQCFRLLFLLGLLSHNPKNEESYIDFVTVSSEFRNMGIGKALILHCKDLFPEKTLTLYVAEHNQKAYELYDRLGFVTMKKQSSIIMNSVIGLKKWAFMELKNN
ncbi:MAG: N-acetyltransferase [Peptostreptococcus sp.]|uniref:N-acetyltransferase n=1 Tax=Peptostreptococcus sp. TaxID=1262 RepID=UPI002FC5FBD8